MLDDGTASRRREARLVERARRGDRQAFDELVAAELPQVWSVVWRILRHREDTEDVVQEVFLTAHQSLAAFRGESRLSTWLHRIAVTRALNHLDRSAERLRRASAPLGDDPEERGAVGEAVLARDQAVETPIESLEAKELLARLRTCLERLPPAMRAILALRESESKSYEQIAEVLSIAVGTVRSRLARARDALRQCVEEEAE